MLLQLIADEIQWCEQLIEADALFRVGRLDMLDTSMIIQKIQINLFSLLYFNPGSIYHGSRVSYSFLPSLLPSSDSEFWSWTRTKTREHVSPVLPSVHPHPVTFRKDYKVFLPAHNPWQYARSSLLLWSFLSEIDRLAPAGLLEAPATIGSTVTGGRGLHHPSVILPTSYPPVSQGSAAAAHLQLT